MLGAVTQDNESGLKEVKSERDLLPQKTFSTKGTNTEIAAVGNDRFLTWLFNKAYNVCMKEKERSVVEETDVNPMMAVNPHQEVEGEEDGVEVSEKCSDDISVPSDAASDDHQIDVICTPDTESLPFKSDHQLDKSEERNVCAPSKTLKMQPKKRKLAGTKKVEGNKKRKRPRQPRKRKPTIISEGNNKKVEDKINRDNLRFRQKHSQKVEICKKAIKVQSKMKNLTLSQSVKQQKQHRCTICDQGYSTKGNLKRHLQIHTGEKPYTCTVCDKAFRYKNVLKRHLRIHTGEKPYKCTVCDKAFIRKENLNKHLRITGEKPYKFTVCDKAFSGKEDLNKPLRIHTGEKPYKCTVCDKAFKFKGNLNRHLVIHTKEKLHMCAVCDKVFRYKHVLKRHLRIHTGEKPYKCTVCDKAFIRKENLNKHLQITGEKPYKCTVSDKALNGKGDLNRHLRIHTGEKCTSL